ncbi:MAG TPA: ABC transporter permease [Coriobacteriia bacterium]
MLLSDFFTPDLFASAIRIATPLALAAIGGAICERSGVVNIALEGIMLVGAFAGVVITLAMEASKVPFLVDNAVWFGVLAAVLAGTALSAIHAFASVTLRMDQIVSGTALNILALGLTGFLLEVIYGHAGATNSVVHQLQPVFDFPAVQGAGFWSDVWYWIDQLVFSYTPIVYMAIIAAIVGQWAMFRTRWGLRLRALGEHPRAADTVGVRIQRGRYMAVLMSGALAGLGGAYLSLEQNSSFSENMTSGRGFIALAANIFGRWTPIGGYLASLLFGFAEALEIKMQGFRDVFQIPTQFFLMLPYVLTVVVLAGFMGRAVGPAEVGVPYEKE